jgi:dihydrofolate synthase/folylpolyglutamate synthase
MDDEAHAVLVDIARQHGARLIEAGKDFTFDYRPPHQIDAHAEAGRLDFKFSGSDSVVELPDAPLRMLGRHQAANAALALATVLELRRQGWLVSTDAMRTGLAEAALPGRIEVVSRRPTVVLDVAHNVASVAALVECLAESFACRRRTLIFAASRDKDVPGMLRVLGPHFQRIILTEFRENPRAAPVGQLATFCRQELEALGRGANGVYLDERADPVDAWELARQNTAPDELVCITGSFFIAAELRALATAAASASRVGA